MLNSFDIPKTPADTRVVVAMSGGVDSAVVAGLVKEEGYDVIGMTLQLYNQNATPQRKGACCAGQDIHDARRVAERLDIPHYVLDYEQRFREAVIDTFTTSYLQGETPVPCIACNQSVKFSDLLATARELGADVLATGHYITSRAVNGRRALFRPADEARDQSYFLFATTQEQLEFLRFPLGEKTKAQTRALAARYGFDIASKPDSQDICFVANGSYTQVIERLKPGAAEPGHVVDQAGRELGRHDGLIHFTVGQRKGLRIAAGEPLYVLALDAATNRVIVGPRSALRVHDIALRDFNWIGSTALEDGQRAFARVRSTRPPQPVTLQLRNGKLHVLLEHGEDGVAPGQACVLYDSLKPRAQILGGGFIEKSAMPARTMEPLAHHAAL